MQSFETIRDDLAFLDQWEERYKYIIDLGRQLQPLSDEEKIDANKVRGCASQVWLVFEDNDPQRLSFRGDSDAHIVKGLVGLMISLFSNQPLQTVLDLDAPALLQEIGLKDHLTPQRSNGLAAMMQKIKHEAANRLSPVALTKG